MQEGFSRTSGEQLSDKGNNFRSDTKCPHTQKELAEAIHLDKDELSKRLNSYKNSKRVVSPLRCSDVQAIVRALARWGPIKTQEQAKELLDLMECPHFSASDWKTNLLTTASSWDDPLPLIVLIVLIEAIHFDALRSICHPLGTY